jgi:phospholipid/cholesterol/gamma-HCH transport system substrate-binding protein
MISSYVRKQLIVFTILAVSAALITVFVYAKIPTVMGFGQMKVAAVFKDGAGIYDVSNVATRGVVIGKVKEINLTPDGVRVDMSIDNSVKIPANARAEIHSVSAVGEIYVDLIGDTNTANSSGPFLEDGAVIPIDRTDIPVQIAPVLDKVTTFIDSFPNDGLQTFLDEGSKAFQNLGPDLRTLVSSFETLVVSADQHYPETKTLINTVGPLLDTQTKAGYGENIKQYFSDLADFTGAFADQDDHFRGAIDTVADAAEEVRWFLEDNENSTPILTKNMRTIGHLLGVYRDGLEQVLVQYPITMAREQRWIRRDNLQVSVVSSIWQACTEGFKGNDLRNAGDMTDKEAVPGQFCKVPHDAPKFVRGARNLPCQEGYVGMRAATVDECFGRRPNQNPYTGFAGSPSLPFQPPGPGSQTNPPFTPPNNQRDYQHDIPVKGGEPLAAFGAVSTAAPAKEASWQSLLTAPLGR